MEVYAICPLINLTHYRMRSAEMNTIYFRFVY